MSDEVVAKIEHILLEDRKVTLRELADQVPEVCEKTIDNILTGKLGYHKVCARWVPHMLHLSHDLRHDFVGHRWPPAPLLVVDVCASFRELPAPFADVLDADANFAINFF